MRQQVLGDRHPDTLNSTNNLAVALQAMGQHAEAAELHQRGLAVRQQVQGEDCHVDPHLPATPWEGLLHFISQQNHVRWWACVLAGSTAIALLRR